MGIARDQADMAAAIRDHHERLRTEKDQRLARYDEALNTISFLVAMFGEFDSDGKPNQASDGKDAAMQRALDFLAAEGKVAG